MAQPFSGGKQDFRPADTFFGNLGKFLGGGLGWGLGGPIGAIIGVIIGSVIDKAAASAQQAGNTTKGDFVVSLLVLVAAIMKADGTVRKVELDYVKQFLVRNFGRDGAIEALSMLKDILKQNIDIAPVCLQIRDNMDYASRLQLMYFLVNVANIDDHFDVAEQRLLEFIAEHIGISAADKESIRSMFTDEQNTYRSRPGQSSAPNLTQAYRILEAEPNADVATIKKAYRTMANKYHPDKVAYLGEDVKKAANEKFQKLNEAYETIKKDKGFV